MAKYSIYVFDQTGVLIDKRESGERIGYAKNE